MLEGFRVQNYGVLKDIKLGRLWNDRSKDIEPLTPLVVVIGRNGSGKSTLIEAFGFLSDCLKVGVEEACDAKMRGGYMNIVSKGVQEPIRFELYYRNSPNERPITYELEIDLDTSGRPFVKSERLRQRRKNQSVGQPFSFLDLKNGKGEAWKGMSLGEEVSEKVPIELTDPRHLGIATIGVLKEHPRIAAFRDFLEGWYLSYFSPDAARSLPMAGPQKHLNMHGDNLGNVVQYMEREYAERFKMILDRIAENIPGIEKISTKRTDDNRLLLQFNDRGFQDPFYAQQMSDGTLKLFAYLLLLEDPSPYPFICIEEPENGLHPKLLESLAEEFRRHTQDKRSGTQLFITTHSPYFADALNPQEVWILEKREDGFSTIQRASEDEIVRNMVREGIPLGTLWYSDYFDRG
jgi:predicted ATPase